MKTMGNAGNYVGGQQGRPLPPIPDTHRRAAHKPWCRDCKKKHEATDLDKDGRCQHCAQTAVARAAAAERRAEREAAEVETKKQAAVDQTAARRVADEREQAAHAAAARERLVELEARATRTTPELPQAGNQGEPTTRPSAPRATSPSSNPGAVPGAGPATTQREDPPAAQETRPAAAGGPSVPSTHVDEVLTRAADVDDPIAGMLRTAALSAIAALDVYLQLHHPAARPTPTSPRPPADHRPAVHRVVRRPRVDIDEQAVLAEYASGDTAPTIARRHGVLAKRIRQILRAHDVELRDDRTGNRGRTIDYTPETLDDVIRRYVAGDSMDAIEKATGIERRQVHKILVAAGIELRPAAHLRHPALTPAEQTAVIEAYLSGLSSVDVGTQYGIRAVTVRELVRNAGHTIRPKGATGTVERLQALGTTAAHVKQWAFDTGLIPRIATGRVPGSLVDAWEAAHQPHQQEGPAA